MRKSLRKFLLLITLALFVLTGGFLILSQNIFAQSGAAPPTSNKINIFVSSVTDHSITLLWQTSEKATSTVYYGTDQNNLNKISENALLANHKFTIFNLNPQTKYFLKVESQSASGRRFDSDIIEATTLEDKTSPANVSQINVVKNQNGQAVLSWRNPNDADFKENIIIMNNEEIFRGPAMEFIFPEIKQNSNILIHSIDISGNKSGGVMFLVGQDGLIIRPSAPAGASALDKKSVYIFAAQKNGGMSLLSPQNGIAQEKIAIYDGDGIIISIDPAIFKKPIVSAYIAVDSLKYLFKQKGKYFQTNITLKTGAEESFFGSVAVEFSDKTTQEATFEISSKMRPEVFAAKNAQTSPVQNAEISLYWQNPSSGNFELWAGSLFNQTNPTFTDQNGKFGYYVLPGTYRLKVKKEGFKDYESGVFSVSGQMIEKSIEIFHNEPMNIDSNHDNNYNDSSGGKIDNVKNKNGVKQQKPQSFNKTVEMLPFLIFAMLGFFIVAGSIIALILLKLHVPHYHSIKKHSEEVHRDLGPPPSKKIR